MFSERLQTLKYFYSFKTIFVVNRVVLGPEKMISVPPGHFCVIKNPVMVDKEGHLVFDTSGQAKLLHADQDIRFCSLEPFPLYPGEELLQPVAALKVVMANSALRLKSVLDFEDDNGYKRIAGDEWLFEGPGFFI